MKPTIRPATGADVAEWLRMCLVRWPDGSADEHALEIDDWLTGPDTVTLVAARLDGSGLVGLVELSLRPCADGCQDRPVAYLEGWWVDPDARGSGIGRALVEAAANWALGRSGTELASDAELDSTGSQRAHAAEGFAEAGRAVLDVMQLESGVAQR